MPGIRLLRDVNNFPSAAGPVPPVPVAAFSRDSGQHLRRAKRHDKDRLYFAWQLRKPLKAAPVEGGHWARSNLAARMMFCAPMAAVTPLAKPGDRAPTIAESFDRLFRSWNTF